MLLFRLDTYVLPTKGDADKFNAFLFKLGGQDSVVDDVVAHPPLATETAAEEIADAAKIAAHTMPSLLDARDVEIGLQILLDPAPLPKPTDREMHCKLTPFKPLPPLKYCCRGKDVAGAVGRDTEEARVSAWVQLFHAATGKVSVFYLPLHFVRIVFTI